MAKMTLGMIRRSIVGLVELAGLGLLFAGCAGTVLQSVSLSAEAKSSIRSVSIKSDVSMPQDTRVWGPAILRGVTNDFGQVVRSAFEDQLKRSGVFPLILTEGADAEFSLAIGNMTIGMATGMCGFLGHCYTPVMVVMGVLRSRDGAVLWRRIEQVTILERKIPKRSASEYEERPQLIREDFTVAARVVVEGLVKDLTERRP